MSEKKTVIIEIRVVENGYLLIPPTLYNSGDFMNGRDVHVFQSFGNLVDWMQHNLRIHNTLNDSTDKDPT